MKKMLISAVAFLFCLSAFPVRAAAGQAVIVYDVSKGDFVRPLPRLTSKTALIVRLINVNTFRDKYTIKLSSIDFHNTPLPSGLNNLLIANPAPKPVVIQAVTGQATPESQSADEDTLTQIDTKLKQPGRLLQAYRNLVTALGQYQQKFQANAQKWDAVLKQAALDEDLIEIIQTHSIPAAGSEMSNLGIRRACIERVRQYFQAIGQPQTFPIPGVCKECEVLDTRTHQSLPQYEVTDYDPQGFASLQQIAVRIPKPAQAAASQRADIYAAFTTTYNSWNQAYVSSRNQLGNDPLATKLDTIATNFSATKTAVDNDQSARSNQESDVTTKLKNAVILFSKAVDPVQTPACIQQSIDPVSADVLQVEVDIDSVPLITAQTQGTDDKSATVPLANPIVTKVSKATLSLYERPVLDFSAGLAVTNLLKRNWYTKTVTNPDGTPVKNPDGSTKMLVLKGASDGVDMSAALLGHFYVTHANGISVGPALGISVGGDNPRYLTGISLVFGNRNRFSLTYGAAFGKVNRLSGGNVEGQPLVGSTLSTESVFRAGEFLSATFNITF